MNPETVKPQTPEQLEATAELKAAVNKVIAALSPEDRARLIDPNIDFMWACPVFFDDKHRVTDVPEGHHGLFVWILQGVGLKNSRIEGKAA